MALANDDDVIKMRTQFVGAGQRFLGRAVVSGRRNGIVNKMINSAFAHSVHQQPDVKLQIRILASVGQLPHRLDLLQVETRIGKRAGRRYSMLSGAQQAVMDVLRVELREGIERIDKGTPKSGADRAQATPKTLSGCCVREMRPKAAIGDDLRKRRPGNMVRDRLSL
jgi:hypothetical protein